MYHDEKHLNDVLVSMGTGAAVCAKEEVPMIEDFSRHHIVVVIQPVGADQQLRQGGRGINEFIK